MSCAVPVSCTASLIASFWCSVGSRRVPVPIDLHAHQLLPIFLVSLVVILVTSEIGRGLGGGRRACGRSCSLRFGPCDQPGDSGVAIADGIPKACAQEQSTAEPPEVIPNAAISGHGRRGAGR